MNHIDMTQIIPHVVACGDFARQQRDQLEITRKSDTSIVTHTDQAVEAQLVASLRTHFPDHAILGEEGTLHGIGGVDQSDYLWVIDPIDGTSAYAGGLPGWCIGVGLLYQGRPIAGVVYAPMNDELFVADASGTTTRNGRPLQAADNDNPLLDEWMAVPSDSHRKYRISYPGRIRTTGATIMSLAYVAAGMATGALIARCKAWDLVPALALLHNAGGAVWDLDGNQFDVRSILPSKRSPTLIAGPAGDFTRIRAHIHTL
jgi:myo-inositol-1(or 4)-monophosphatase